MLYHMVQEKYQDKLKIIIIQFIMLTYFLSVIMKDPVKTDSIKKTTSSVLKMLYL